MREGMEGQMGNPDNPETPENQEVQSLFESIMARIAEAQRSGVNLSDPEQLRALSSELRPIFENGVRQIAKESEEGKPDRPVLRPLTKDGPLY